MQLYFIRHGQSSNNALWERTGSDHGRSHDPELTPIGQQQAERLAALLCQHDPAALPPYNAQDSHNRTGFGLTHLYTSPMLRAIATGTVVARALNLPLHVWLEAHEVGGLFLDDELAGEPVGQPGPGRAELAARFPDLHLPESLGEAGWWGRPFETWEERTPRAQRFVRQLLERHASSDDRVAVFSHGGFYNHLLPALLDWPMREGYGFVINNAAITRVDFQRDATVLVYHNRVDFLPSELIT